MSVPTSAPLRPEGSSVGWRGYLCLALFCGLLVCLGEGGGPWPEATGQEAIGITEGTVSGFGGGTVAGSGSVAVDGIDYGDAALEPAVVASLRLGQRVRLAFDAGGSARSLTVLPQLRGPVDRAPDGDGWFQVTGQWVRIVLHPADASRSGVTLLGGYGAAAAVQAGQLVEVHGSWVFDAGKGAHVLVATRVEQRAPGEPVLTGGVVHALAARAFRLNMPTGVRVRADRLPALADGQVVTVRLASPAPAAGAAGLRALEVRNASLGALDLASYTAVRLGGVADGYDAAARSVTVQGTRLALAPDMALEPALCTPAEAAWPTAVDRTGVPPESTGSMGLAAGRFMRASLRSTPQGMLRVDTLALRSVPVAGQDSGDVGGVGGVDGRVRLRGVLAGVDWNAAVLRVALRGVPVVADAAAIGGTCREAPSWAALQVVLEGFAPQPGAALVATRVACTAAAPAPALHGT